MPIVQTGDMTPGQFAMDPARRLQVYNGLDSCLTLEIHQTLETLDPPGVIYDFERALQAPAMEMMLRGFLIDETARHSAIMGLERKLQRLDLNLQRYAHAIWNTGINVNSPKQLQSFFYGAMRIPEHTVSVKGVRRVSTNRETLEKLELYFYARPIISTILAIRDISKQLEVFQTEIDPDGRLRTSYNIAGTETGRWSSSSGSEGTGRNVQNIDRALRYVFQADPGFKLCGIDLEQAESREVGWQCGVLFDDWSYLDACYAGDLHTIVCQMCWEDLPWTGDLAKDKSIAERIFYRTFTYRDMAKKLGHGSNYYGQPFTMARHAKVVQRMVEDFQDAYFRAFPGIQKWHTWTAGQIQTNYRLVTPFGRERHFFGRPNDDTTLREAIAYVPQSSTADRMNLGLYRIWRDLGTTVQLLAQVHDAVYFQYPEEIRGQEEDDLIGRALHLIDVQIEHNGHRLVVPGEPKTGWNWGDFNGDAARGRLNPNGLKKWKAGAPDQRSRLSGLDRVL